MGAHDGRVDHGIFVIRVTGQMIEYFFPYAPSGPTAKPGMHHTKITKSFRQVTPRNPGSIAIQYRFHEPSVIFRRTTYRTLPSGQQTLDPLPLVVPQPIASCNHAAKLSAEFPLAYNQFDDSP